MKKLINPLSVESTQNQLLFSADGSADITVVLYAFQQRNDHHLSKNQTTIKKKTHLDQQ
jgi:hypothetical protein